MVMSALLALSVSDLAALRDALRSGRLAAPYLPALVERIVPGDTARDVSTALQRIDASGANHEGLVAAVDLLVEARAGQQSLDEIVELVTTAPENGPNRDTQVVVQELFRGATKSVLVAGYELYQAEPLFRTLADRTAAEAGLCVRMFLNIKRPVGDTSADSQLIAGFAHRFRTKHWPGNRPLPEIYFDPRSISTDSKRKAVLHAKCIVVDGRLAFVSSANFTEAAQERNIEVGLLVRSRAIAERLLAFFDGLTEGGLVRRLS